MSGSVQGVLGNRHSYCDGTCTAAGRARGPNLGRAGHQLGGVGVSPLGLREV